MGRLLDLVEEKIKNPALKDFMLNDMISNVTPVNGVASQGTLTITAQVTVGDTMTIGTKVYTFVADGTEEDDGDISIGTDLATCQANIVGAINGTDSINTAHSLVTAGDFSTNVCTITAITKGVAGDLIATTETFTGESNVFNGTTLGETTAGVNGTRGTKGQMTFDSSYLYMCIANNTISCANWRRVSLGSVY